MVSKQLNLPKVFCQAPTLGADRLFDAAGFRMVDNPVDAHWIVLCGGSDIASELYDEPPIPNGTDGVDGVRDKIEVALIEAFRGKKTFIGICRGAQLLNVKAGGKLYQHVDSHCNGPHEIRYISGSVGKVGVVNSVHHQQMRPAAQGAVLIGWAKESKFRHYYDHMSKGKISEKREDQRVDPEIIWYPKDKFYCFQAHPEFGHDETTEIFFRSLADTVPLTV